MSMNRMMDIPIYQAFRVWFSFYSKDKCDWLDTYKYPFADYLGSFEGRIESLQSWKLTPEGQRKLRLLLTPHARTIVKIYFLQHPELPTPPLLWETKHGQLRAGKR